MADLMILVRILALALADPMILVRIITFALAEPMILVRIRALVKLNRKEDARVALAKLEVKTLGQAVRGAWAGSFLGTGSLDAFPKCL